MRVAGRQKGAKVKSYTHILVNPTAPKTRYVFSMHSTEAGAQKAAKKYSPLVGHELKVVKQSGKSPSTDMFEDLGTGGTTTASIPNPADTAMGPRLKTTTMHDKRRRKDKLPVLLKRFRKYIEDNHGK